MTLAESLTDLCGELRSWFDYERYFGVFTITGGELDSFAERLKPGQYYRVLGSVFHDGVHQYGVPSEADTGSGTEETFDGAVWAMAVPPAVVRLAGEIAAWREKYEAVSSPALSPFTQESFGGYSYTKGALNGGSGGGGGAAWRNVFAARLNQWRKL